MVPGAGNVRPWDRFHVIPLSIAACLAQARALLAHLALARRPRPSCRDGNPGELAWFDEFQRQTRSPENAVRFQNAFGDIDVREMLGAVRAPTLVLHAHHDQRITLEQGRELATGIPGARFVPLESRSHIVLGHEPAWAVPMREVDQFLSEHEAR